MSKLKTSVVMSVYNGEQNVQETLISVLNQSFKDFEFIIINDKSIDKTGEILESWAMKDKRIKIINNDVNLGLSKSLIKGVEVSSGEYIARIDAGDLMKETRLERQKKILDNDINKNIGIVTTNCIVTYIYNGQSEFSKLKVPTTNKKIKQKMPFLNIIPHVSVMFRKEIYNKVGGYDGQLTTSQDFDLWTKMLKFCDVFSIQEYLTEITYDNSLSSISLHKNKEQRKNGIIIMKRALKTKVYPKHLIFMGLIRKYSLSFLPSYLLSSLRKYTRNLTNKQ